VHYANSQVKVYKDVDLEAMPSSIFVNDDDDEFPLLLGLERHCLPKCS